MSTCNLIVSGIQIHHNAEYIANTFWNQNIAQIKSIILTPYLHNSTFYQTAYIHIQTWCDTEIAYNFIKRLQDKRKVTKIVHYVDDWWPVSINRMNIKTLMQMYKYSGKYLTKFNQSYYIKEETNSDLDIVLNTELSKNVTLRPHQLSFATF